MAGPGDPSAPAVRVQRAARERGPARARALSAPDRRAARGRAGARLARAAPEMDVRRSGLYRRYELMVAWLLERQGMTVEELLARRIDPAVTLAALRKSVESVGPDGPDRHPDDGGVRSVRGAGAAGG